MAAEDQAADDETGWDVDGQGHRPPLQKHRFADPSDERDIARNGRGATANGGQYRHGGPTPRVEGAARCRGLEDLLGNERKEEDEANVVHWKRERLRHAEIALRKRVGPHQRRDAADRKRDHVVEAELDAATGPVTPAAHRGRRGMGGSHGSTGPEAPAPDRTWRRMIPESTTCPERAPA